MPAAQNALFLFLVAVLAAVPWSWRPADLAFGSPVWAQEDDDDNGGGASSDDDDNGGGGRGGGAAGGGGASSDDDDNGGGGPGGGAAGGGGGGARGGGSSNDDDDGGGGRGSPRSVDDDDGGGFRFRFPGRAPRDDGGRVRIRRAPVADDDLGGARRRAPLQLRTAAPPEPRPVTVAPRVTPFFRGPAQRQGEISAVGLTPQAQATLAGLDYVVVSQRQSALLGSRTVARIRTPAGLSVADALQQARQLFPAITFDLTHLYAPAQPAPRPAPQEPPEPRVYAAAMTRLDDGSSCAAGIGIGLVDSGVADHPALRGAQVEERSFLDGTVAADTTHGTAIAAMLVGATPATAPLAAGASLHSAIVFDGEGDALRGDVTAIVAALDWLAQSQVGLVNLSLAGPPNLLLEEAVQAAADLGMVLVAAAGNQGPNAPPVYPGGYPSVIAVAAVDWRGRPYEMNNRGPYIEIAAPGVDVLSARAEGGTAYWTGTSFAVPFATAALARALAEGTVADVGSARRYLAASARDLGPMGRDPVYGWGLLQAGPCSG